MHTTKFHKDSVEIKVPCLSLNSEKYEHVKLCNKQNSCKIPETEIHNLLRARLQCKRVRDYQKADSIQKELMQFNTLSVHIM